jgi:phage tail-like protein
VLERGVTHDPGFGLWAAEVWKPAAAPQSVRKDVRIEMMDEIGEPVAAWDVLDCLPSEFTTLPELDANVAAIAIDNLKLEHEGCVRAPLFSARG